MKVRFYETSIIGGIDPSNVSKPTIEEAIKELQAELKRRDVINFAGVEISVDALKDLKSLLGLNITLSALLANSNHSELRAVGQHWRENRQQFVGLWEKLQQSV